MTANELALISLPDLRHLLVEARTHLRTHQDRLKVVEAQAETDEIAAKGGDEKALGSNEAARRRALTLALSDNAQYSTLLWRVRDDETDVERLAAEIDGRLDARRERELAVRDKLADALLALGERDTTATACRATGM